MRLERLNANKKKETFNQNHVVETFENGDTLISVGKMIVKPF